MNLDIGNGLYCFLMSYLTCNVKSVGTSTGIGVGSANKSSIGSIINFRIFETVLAGLQ